MKTSSFTSPSLKEIFQALQRTFEDFGRIRTENMGSGTMGSGTMEQAIRESFSHLDKELERFGKVGDDGYRISMWVEHIVECWGVLSVDDSLKDPDEQYPDSRLRNAMKKAYSEGRKQDPRGLDLALFGDPKAIAERARKGLLRLKKSPSRRDLDGVSRSLWMLSYSLGVRMQIREVSHQDPEFAATLGPEWGGFVKKMASQSILKRAKSDPAYRKQMIARLKRASIDTNITPYENAMRFRREFLSLVLEQMKSSLGKDWKVGIAHDIMLISDQQRKFFILVKWKSDRGWELGVKVGGDVKFSFGFDCEHLVTTEVAGRVLDAVFAKF